MPRLDSWLTLNVSGGGRAAEGGSPAIPVLMYHSISSDPEPGVKPYYRVATCPERFAEQMKWISELGCRGVSVEEALEILASGQASPKPVVAITFDDGFRDFLTDAWPVLRKHGFGATMYLPTAFIGSQRKKFLGKDCLTWDEVRALKSDGARFGSHTVNHPKLYQLSWPEIEKELRDSKSQIERELGTECGSFTYPYAFPQEDTVFTSRFAELLKRLGYHHCNTTVIGRLRSGDDVFKIKRLPANDCDDRALFTAKLAGNYDWMGRMQTTFRRLKRILRVGPARPVDLSATPAHAAA